MKTVGKIFREGLVAEVKQGLEDNEAAFLLSYSNLSANQIGELRKKLSDAGASVFVSKNKTAAIALRELKHDALADRVEGQTAFVWTSADSAAVSKILIDQTKDCETFAVQGGVLDGRILEKADVKKLSDLPPREVLLGQLLGTLQAPVSRLLSAFNAKSRDLLSILKQYSESREGKE